MDRPTRACFVMALLMAGSVGDLCASSFVDPCVNFTAPVVTNGQAAIVLRGEPGVSYVVQSSSDLQNWAPIATNSDSTITRTVTFPAPDAAGFYRVARDLLPRFDCAVATQGAISMSGTGLVTDSYNSADPNLSSNGQYVASMASTNGNVASLFGPVSLGNHVVNGNLYLGPTVNPAGVGPGTVTGSIRNDFNTCFPDVTMPWMLTDPLLVSAPAETNTYIFDMSGSYKISNGNWPIVVLPGVSAQVRVDATNFNPGMIHIMIEPISGISGSLNVYQISGSMSLGGGVTIDSGSAWNFYYWGMSGVTNITCSGSSTFYGVIYAPEANLTLVGGGSANNSVGALVAKSLMMIGHWAVHFDESLREYGPKR